MIQYRPLSEQELCRELFQVLSGIRPSQNAGGRKRMNGWSKTRLLSITGQRAIMIFWSPA